MPKKKAVPDPVPKLETGPVPAVEVAEDPSAAPAGMAEDTAALPDGSTVPGSDDSAPIPDSPHETAPDMALRPKAGEAAEIEAGERPTPELRDLDPEPCPDVGSGSDGEPPMLLDLAGTLWPSAEGDDMSADMPEWEQAPFPDVKRPLDGTAPAPDASALLDSGMPGDVSAGEETVADKTGEVLPAGETAGDADSGPPGVEGHTVHKGDAQTASASHRRAARPARRTAADRQETPDLSADYEAQSNGGQSVSAAEDERRRFYDLDFNALDRSLSPEQRQEWNSIYASYRGRSVLTGAIAGVDRHSVRVRDRRTGEMMRQDMYCATVIPFRVRILIPSTEMWMQGEERPDYVLRNMSGAVIDFVVTHVDREAGFAIASRRLALRARRYYFSTQPSMNRSGARAKCHVLAVGPRRCLVECGGYDIDLTQREMRYTAIPDLREQYHRGDALDCIVKEYDRESGKLVISVKETNPNPFDGAELRHPEGSRRQAEIAGKYAGGVFCNLPDGAVVMCSYSFHYDDAAFSIGDKVIVMIQRYDFNKKQIYGKIVAKW